MCPGQRISTPINTSSLAANQQVSCKQRKMSEEKPLTLFPNSSACVPTVQRTSVAAKNKVQSKCDKHIVLQPPRHRVQTMCTGEQNRQCFPSLPHNQFLDRLLGQNPKVTVGTVAEHTTPGFGKNAQVSTQPDAVLW